MNSAAIGLVALIVGGGVALVTTRGQEAPGSRGTDRATAPAAHNVQGASPRETVTVGADRPIPNAPGKRLVSRIVDYPPAGRSAPHRHASSAFIYAYVISGRIRSQVNDEPARVYGPGETWFENPGSRHPVSENASDTEPARLLAVVVVDEADKELTIPDGR